MFFVKFYSFMKSTTGPGEYQLKNKFMRGFFLAAVAVIALSVAPDALADSYYDDKEEVTSGPKQDDRFEKTNRKIFAFNKGVDKLVLRPTVEKVYRRITFSGAVRQRIRDVLNNLQEPTHMVNSIFYGNSAGFFRSGLRFLINSTLGIGGIFDVAKKLKVEKNDISFSDVMAGKMCLKNGPYVMLPVLGPSTARNATGLFIDKVVLDPLNFIFPISVVTARLGTEIIATKDELYPQIDAISKYSLDDYIGLRSAYYQMDVAKEFTTYDSSKK